MGVVSGAVDRLVERKEHTPCARLEDSSRASRAPRSRAPSPCRSASLRNPEANFFILGAKSYGRNSHFLLKTGFEQVREVFTLITGKPDLDLYKKR